ncbi:hypothetical protein E3T37_16125 [Cryobacterium sp. TMT2-10]|nr:hypothetical protein E3T24_08535 [Cryobacterium sp. TmT2-59]TFD35019.1 hypothetical protein E3T37_16125 [Cryobacterium sp. TMT2-10]
MKQILLTSVSIHHTGANDLIALSLPEIRYLLVRLIFSEPPDPERVLSRSRWRRRHQQTAKRHHYRTRGHAP